MKFKVHYQNIGIESNDVLSLFEKKNSIGPKLEKKFKNTYRKYSKKKS